MATTATLDASALYTAHAPWLCEWLRSRTRCAERAADLTQDTFCKLIERAGATVPDNPRTYLATVARRLLIDDIRRREVERAYLAALALHGEAADLLTPERYAEAVQMLVGLGQLLATLPEETRTAFLLRRLDGLRHDEIAERLNVSTRTVKRYIADAYARCYALAYCD